MVSHPSFRPCPQPLCRSSPNSRGRRCRVSCNRSRVTFLCNLPRSNLSPFSDFSSCTARTTAGAGLLARAGHLQLHRHGADVASANSVQAISGTCSNHISLSLAASCSVILQDLARYPVVIEPRTRLQAATATPPPPRPTLLDVPGIYIYPSTGLLYLT